jgi:predicted MFS family arabinose efflux permease
MSAVLATSCIAFIISAKLVAEPVFPLRLWTQYAAVTNFAILFLQVMNQCSLTLTVPLYFQVTNKSSTAAAGAYLIPAFVGNMLGGLLAGYWIKRTGWYKVPTVMGPALSIVAMSLCYFAWKGHTTVLGSMAIFPGGFAAGMVSSSAFVGLAADVAQEDLAIASSGCYLFFNLGAIAGTSAGSAIYQGALKAGLKDALEDVNGGAKVSTMVVELVWPADLDTDYTACIGGHHLRPTSKRRAADSDRANLCERLSPGQP